VLLRASASRPGVRPVPLQKGRSDSRRDLYGHESVRGEQVVLAALVDDPQVAIALGVGIR
jgi:hypothetical protein